MLQTLPPIPLLNIRLITIPRQPQDLIIILRLAPLQRHLRLLHLRLSGLAVGVRLSVVHGGFEVPHGVFVGLELKVDTRAGAEGFEGGGGEGERGGDGGEGLVVVVQLGVVN